MIENDNKLKTYVNKKVIITSGIIGLAAGLILCAISIFVMMPSMMIVTKESNLGFDETVSALEKSIVDVDSIAFKVAQAFRDKWLAANPGEDNFRRPGPIRFTGKSEEERPITLELNALATADG